MNKHGLIVVTGLVLTLTGCGGGGSGGGTDISVAPRSIELRVGSEDPTDEKSIDVRFTGDGVVAGFAPGVTAPSWLQVSQSSPATDGRVSFLVSADAGFFGLAPGRYSSSLRFATGRLNGNSIDTASDIRTSDVPISLIVSDFSVQPHALSIEVVDGGDGSTLPALNTLRISGSDLNWSVSSDAAWLAVSRSAGNAQATLQLSINSLGLPRGTHTGHLNIRNAATDETSVVTVTLLKRLPRLTTRYGDAGAPAFTVDQQTPASALGRALVVTDELNGADAGRVVNWSLKSIDVPWLSLDAPSIDVKSGPPRTLHLALVPEEVAKLANGSHGAQIVLRYRNAEDVDGELIVPVQLDLNLPRLNTVAPYLVFGSQPQSLILRGAALADADRSKLRVGTMAPSSITVINDTALRIEMPSMPAGRYPVQLPNAAGIPSSTAELLVRPSPVYPYKAFSRTSPIPYLRLIFDDERATLYGVDNSNHLLDRYQFNGIDWVKTTAINVPGMADAAMSADGRSLVVVGDAGLQALSLDASPPSLSTLVSVPADATVNPFFASVGVLNDGRMVVLVDSHCCSGVFPGYLFDPRAGTLTRQYDIVNRPQSKTAPNRSRVYVNIGRVGYVDALDGQLRNSLYPVGMSASGDRVTAEVSDGSFTNTRVRVFDSNDMGLGYLSTLQGSPLPPYRDDGLSQPLLSPDGRTAYLFGCGNGNNESYSNEGRIIRVADLSATPDANGNYPVTRTITVNDAIYPTFGGGFGCADAFQRQIISADGGTAFVVGSQNLVIVPLR